MYNFYLIHQDTLRSNCNGSTTCKSNCCISRYVAPLFFVSFVLFAQFVLVNVLIAVLMKHLRIDHSRKKDSKLRKSCRERASINSKMSAKDAVSKWRSNVSSLLQLFGVIYSFSITLCTVTQLHPKNARKFLFFPLSVSQ